MIKIHHCSVYFGVEQKVETLFYFFSFLQSSIKHLSLCILAPRQLLTQDDMAGSRTFRPRDV